MAEMLARSSGMPLWYPIAHPSRDRMYTFRQVERVHLELTTRCNAACPMCSRNVRGGSDNPNLPLTELSLEDITQLLTPAFLRQLKTVWLCGNYGDPSVASDTLAILDYFKHENPRLHVGMSTNGSARQPEWWRSLAGRVDICVFGIDGLEDTNHLYRRRTSWECIMQNAAAFISAGGLAAWEFIVFRHNEHQVEAARQLAASHGFSEFRLRKTSRFLFRGELLDHIDVKGRRGDVEYEIEPPVSDALSHSTTTRAGIASEKAAYSEHLDVTPISCKAEEKREIYISAEGYVIPCCFLGSFYKWYHEPSEGQFWQMLESNGGMATVDGRANTIEAIVNGVVFQDLIPMSWSKESVAEGRLAVCSAVCGTCTVASQRTASLI